MSEKVTKDSFKKFDNGDVIPEHVRKVLFKMATAKGDSKRDLNP